MAIMGNKWIHKEATKKAKIEPTAPSYQSERMDDTLSAAKPVKRFSMALRAHLVKTLRGIRK